jgi:ribosomal 50S subunit-recycling heat shock protein
MKYVTINNSYTYKTNEEVTFGDIAIVDFNGKIEAFEVQKISKKEPDNLEKIPLKEIIQIIKSKRIKDVQAAYHSRMMVIEDVQ